MRALKTQKPINWDNLRENEYKCHSCRYRHGCFYVEPISYCKDYVHGGCYSCKYYYSKNGENFTKQEADQWFKRGCEIWCLGGCEKRKRLSRKRKKRLKKRGLI